MAAGEREGSIYKNKMLGIEFDSKESDFVYDSDNEHKDGGNATADRGDIELIKKSLEAGATAIDMEVYSCRRLCCSRSICRIF